MKGITLDKKLIESLTDIHIARFTARAERARQGHSSYNLSDCERYLDIWKSIEAKGYDFDKLSSEEKTEVLDAVADERG